MGNVLASLNDVSRNLDSSGGYLTRTNIFLLVSCVIGCSYKGSTPLFDETFHATILPVALRNNCTEE
jgi:hypothetical protein